MMMHLEISSDFMRKTSKPVLLLKPITDRKVTSKTRCPNTDSMGLEISALKWSHGWSKPGSSLCIKLTGQNWSNTTIMQWVACFTSTMWSGHINCLTSSKTNTKLPNKNYFSKVSINNFQKMCETFWWMQIGLCFL